MFKTFNYLLIGQPKNLLMIENRGKKRLQVETENGGIHQIPLIYKPEVIPKFFESDGNNITLSFKNFHNLQNFMENISESSIGMGYSYLFIPLKDHCRIVINSTMNIETHSPIIMSFNEGMLRNWKKNILDWKF